AGVHRFTYALGGPVVVVDRNPEPGKPELALRGCQRRAGWRARPGRVLAEGKILHVLVVSGIAEFDRVNSFMQNSRVPWISILIAKSLRVAAAVATPTLEPAAPLLTSIPLDKLVLVPFSARLPPLMAMIGRPSSGGAAGSALVCAYPRSRQHLVH